MRMKLKIGVSGSAAGNINRELEKKAYVVGQEIAQKGAILITGACAGLPLQAARGAKSKKGLVVGISPGENLKDHIKSFKHPTQHHDIVLFTGSGKKGRNVVFVHSCDALICIAGRTGTLNEFTIAYDDQVPLGILVSGGITELIPQIVEISKKTRTPVFYDEDPKKLVSQLIKHLRKS